MLLDVVGARVDDDCRITVKRDPGGLVSNWLNDTAAEGGEIHAAPPEGRFVLRDRQRRDDRSHSPAEAVSRRSSRWSGRRWRVRPGRVRLFYANRARESVIFADALDRLADDHADRLTAASSLRRRRGVVTPQPIERSSPAPADADYYVCGPAPVHGHRRGRRC